MDIPVNFVGNDCKGDFPVTFEANPQYSTSQLQSHSFLTGFYYLTPTNSDANSASKYPEVNLIKKILLSSGFVI
jgi:hypothetical protein